MTAQHLPRRPDSRPRARLSLRPLILLLTVLLVLLSVALVVLSPFALDASGDDREWARRSEIGQTYGAAAALLSVLALAAIGVSLVLQAREAKIAREQASRATHTELLFMAMEDPMYRECWGPFTTAQDEREFKQQLYTNLIVSYWQSRYELGTFTEEHLRHGAGTLFMGQPGRSFWEQAREPRMRTSRTRKARRFHTILDEEYRKAVAAVPTLPSALRARAGRSPRVSVLLRGIADLVERRSSARSGARRGRTRSGDAVAPTAQTRTAADRGIGRKG
ncbi:DUF6082 family protein [Thermopolyspora sp. NPDC052614]|uniref:DUF6082 family protein n=1 Tax=Thermopolyspora sp. NPDC052614 TaxID=3155682 RepID=UPI003444807D